MLELSQELFREDLLSLALVGPYENDARFRAHLRFEPTSNEQATA